ncbi:LIC_12708 family protein [Spirochaeta isovalerica]|uniref:Uncharacterized protein n=1 Tax=Spirochaeta isovalerica TaxID=150 RepID=A0A841R880_9SPIO|nr:hypothetical protein [Spirochaeta isovalerica]MBB6478672.1 hypothetical protein [Spirochaeta isovalerica]
MLNRSFFFISVSLILLLNSCGSKEVKTLEKVDLFSIPLGKLAEEIDYFQRESLRFSADNDMEMLNGFFYITNGRSGKLLKFNSYGDLLTLIYNPDRNPYPAELLSRQSDDSEVNRKVIPWQFNSPGALAVSEDSIFIVDKVAPNRQVKDKNTLMDRNILQFTSQGEYVNFIGMEGTGGQPFPYIEDLWISDKSELIVLYRTRSSDDESWYVNWYTPSGTLRYSVEIRESVIPMPAGETDLSISLDSILPDLSHYEIFLKMTYFRSADQASSDEVSEIFGGTLNFSVAEKKWHDWTRLPENTLEVDGIMIDSPYSLIGTAKGKQFFLSLSENSMYSLLIRDEEGLFSEEYRLLMDDREILNTDFYLSDAGILCAMVYTDSEARIIWWRTDKLLEINDENG